MSTQSQAWNRPLAELVNPWSIGQALHAHRELIRQFTKREILSRFRGSFLGMFLSLVRPLAMLAVYAFVFGLVIPTELGKSGGRFDFVLALFCGLLLFDFAADCLARAPTLVRAKPNYVTRVVFPLEILAVSVVGAAFMQMLIGFAVFFAALLVAHGGIPLTALLLPVVVLPLVLMVLGVTWMVASLGVYIRDVNAIVPVVLTILLFASAIFYSIEQVPAEFRWLMQLNPLAVLVTEARKVVLWGLPPDWIGIAVYLAAGIVVAAAGYAFFMKTKRGFADVM